ncbi:TonB-dependent receptor [Caulobacter segnis]|uniref:TonB-dependent receptor n=2 Tax=Caulobacter segnis TaxID=88688 RepID=D5VKJ3_CAUST|nr:TonB-dependent receptor [Caulobacter segnis]ADG11016.1 TonB-dependent receptor [Caulobacter segnis ATCC 21756]AVQ02706.1 TonB-dependent receptor [Caulobacter segnis]
MSPFSKRFWVSSALSVLTFGPVWTASAAAAPQVEEQRVSITLAAGPLDQSLLRLAQLTHVRIMFQSQMVAGLKAPAVQGQMSPREALDQLLVGTGLEPQQARPGVLVLRRAPTPIATARPVAQPARAAAPVQAPTRRHEALDDTVTQVDEIVVGSHIRGVKDGPSPVIVLGRDDIDRAGYATVADALTSLPQMFGGTTADDVTMVGSDPTNTNSAFSTAVNLRGLGPDATLVLINGRRMAGAGLMGDFADVSMIPLSAVARIEVLTDGASALYGSDAVGGVVNVVMRDRYEGGETRLRYGGSTRGDLGQYQIAQTFGKIWGSGSVLVSAEFQRRDSLAAGRRDLTESVDLRRFGGLDHRLFYSQPGTVLIADPVTFALKPGYAIPAGQDGTHLRPSDFLAGQQNLFNYRQGTDILPMQERGSLYVAASQALGARVTLNAEARYSDRRFATFGYAPMTVMTVSANNPYFVSPNGAPSLAIAYSLANETGGSKSAGEVQSRSLTLGAKIDLPATWRLDLYALHAEELGSYRASGMLNSTFLNEALGNTPDNPATAYSAARDGYFNPFIGTGRNNAAVLGFITQGYQLTQTVGRLDTVSASADGPLWRLPAGALRLAVGAQIRTERLKNTGSAWASGLVPYPTAPRQGERTVSAVYAELRAPLFGDSYRRPGVERLELSAAVRSEHYDGGPTSTVPKLGVVWSPIADWTLKGTYGRSFRAPSLGELTDAQKATPVNLTVNGANVLTLLLYGGNPGLRPETATSWSAGLEFAPAAHPEIRLAATLFDTEFRQRIGQPAINNLSTVLTASDLAPFRQFISPASNGADLALVQSYLRLASSAAASLYQPQAYQAIADARYVNTGTLAVRGLDLTGSYRLTTHNDPVVVSGNLSWLLSSSRRITAAARKTELVGTVENPADLRARLSAAWTHGPFTTTVTLNHVGDLHTPAGARLASQTTADLQLQFAAPARRGPLRGLNLALTVQNLFDKDPPFYDSPQGVGFDAANYDVLGRVVALQLTKAW